MRYLAIDVGDKRTGLALGDDITDIVTPLDVLHAPRGAAQINMILQRIAEHGPDALILGLPLNMDGTEGDRARLVRAFGDELSQSCELPLHYQDERLTSYAADQQMAQSGRTHKQKKQLRDALAAAHILRDFLDGQS